MKTLSKAIVAGLVVFSFAIGGCGNDLEAENIDLKAKLTTLEHENQMLKEQNGELRGLVTDLRDAFNALNKIVGKTLPEEMAEASK